MNARTREYRWSSLFMVLSAILLLIAPEARADILYVDFAAALSGAGTSWATGFQTLQEAVDAAADGDEIWVKDVNPNPRPDGVDYFNMAYNVPVVIVDKAVGIYGGFAGTETEREQRDWVNNEIVISGGGVSTHVFEVTASATIDGFTIQGAHAYNHDPWDSPNNYGGGMYIISPDAKPIVVTLRNCTLRDNQADYGGGFYVNSASVTMENCLVDSNTANQWGAGGFVSLGKSNSASNSTSFVVRGATVSNNRSYGIYGGGLCLGTAQSGAYNTILMEDSLIDTNRTADSGGGIWGSAGGWYSSLTIRNSRITGNRAGTNGGGFYGGENVTIENCLIDNNTVDTRYGGGLYTQTSVTLRNLTVTGNYAGTLSSGLSRGGGIFNSWDSGTTIYNSTVWGNDCQSIGDEVYPDITRTYFSNTDVSIYGDPALSTYNEPARGNLSTAPTYVDAASGNYRFGAGSAGIDAGSNGEVLAGMEQDLDGEPRFIDDPSTTDGGSGTAPIVDMGAFEYGTAPADYDSDGIANDIDGTFTGALVIVENGVPSDNFTDFDAGGATWGSIVSRADLTLTVEDAAAGGDGVTVTAGGGGAGTATVSACGYVHEFTAGDTATITCSTLTTAVTAGTVRIIIATDVTVDVPAGATVTIDRTTTNWTIACAGTASLTVQHPSGPTILAAGESSPFTSDYVQMTMASAPYAGGSTTPATGSAEVDKGVGQSITAAPAAGYRWDGWTAFPAANAVFVDDGLSSTDVTLSGDATVRANFVATAELTMAVVPAATGTTTPTGTTDVDEGVATSITANPATGYVFIHWTADPSGNASFGIATSSTTTVTLSGNATVTANFADELTLTMAVSPPAGGTTAPAVGPQSVGSGIATAITATAATGYTFDGWTADPPGNAVFGDAAAESTTVTLSGDAQVEASFLEIAGDDVCVYRAGAWLFHDYDTASFTDGVWTGAPGTCIPAPADFNGDGDPEFSQLCGGAWHFYSSDGSYLKGIWTGGVAGDMPVPADYDGNGTDEVVIFRGGAWLFFDYTTGDYSTGVWTGAPDHWTGGTPTPVPMDYDGDGAAEFTVYSGGPWHFYNDDGTYNKGIWTGGVAGDMSVAADYDGDGTDEVVVFRAGAWLAYAFDTGQPTWATWTGMPDHWHAGESSLPAPLDSDGDGAVDLTVYSGGPWHFFNDDGTYDKGIWTGGILGDQPISRRLLP